MTEKTTIKKSLNAQPLENNDKSPKVTEPKIVKISGILTSNLRTRESSNTPYYAFLWLKQIFERPKDNKLRQRLIELMAKHDNYGECANAKCKDCEIPVVFRLKECDYNCSVVKCKILKCQKDKPNLNKGDKVLLEGVWAVSDPSQRPSFTAYSYQILTE